MAGAGSDALAHAALYRPGASAVVEEGHVLLPGQPDHHEQPVALGGVEQPPGRHRVHAHGVDALLDHRREVALDQIGVIELAGHLVGRERPVRHAADVELPIVGVEVAPAYGRAAPGRRGGDAGDARHGHEDLPEVRLWEGGG
jgi:hypothetical protein